MSAQRTATGSWPAEASSVREARRLVRAYLDEHAVTQLAEDAELIITELVTNVVLHVGGVVDVSAQLEDRGSLLLEVRDRSTTGPLLRSFSATSSTGRGMRLVHSLSAEHGVQSGDGGKTIWVRLTAGTAGQGDADLAEAFAGIEWFAALDDRAGPEGLSGRGTRAATGWSGGSDRLAA